MNKYILAIAPVFLACNIVSAGEQASYEGGLYGNIFGGVALFEDGAVDVAANPSGESSFEIESGYSAGLLLGYDFGTFRVEGEFSHITGDIDELELDTGDTGVNSDFESNSLMINGLVDFEFESVPLTLSLGAGLGASQIDYSSMKDSLNNDFVLVDGVDETVFVYQGIIRGTYSFNDRASLGLSYRYVVTDDINGSGTVDTGATTTAESDIDFDSVGVSLFEVFFSYKF